MNTSDAPDSILSTLPISTCLIFPTTLARKHCHHWTHIANEESSSDFIMVYVHSDIWYICCNYMHLCEIECPEMIENCSKVIVFGYYFIFKILFLGERTSICAIKQLHCFHLYFWYMCVLRLPESGGHERAGWVLGPSLKSALTFSCTLLRKSSTNLYLEYNSAWK